MLTGAGWRAARATDSPGSLNFAHTMANIAAQASNVRQVWKRRGSVLPDIEAAYSNGNAAALRLYDAAKSGNPAENGFQKVMSGMGPTGDGDRREYNKDGSRGNAGHDGCRTLANS